MADLKINVFKTGETAPKETVTIPGGVLRIASKLLPKQATNTLQKRGIDLDEIVRLSQDSDARGILIEVEEHEKEERVVISLE